MIRSLAAVAALLIGSQVAAQDVPAPQPQPIPATGEWAADDDDGNEDEGASAANLLDDPEVKSPEMKFEDLCDGAENLALTASPSGSGGGRPGRRFGPENMNDKETCNWYWPRGRDGKPVIQYNWDSPVTFGRFVIRTQEYCAIHYCETRHARAGRGVYSGEVQYWDDNNYEWKTDGQISSNSETIYYDFNDGVITTKAIRVIKIHTDPCGQKRNPTIMEWSVCAPSYKSPPESPECPEMDANDEVLLPVLLDENETKVIFNHGVETMQVKLIVPKQYSTLKVTFEGADSDGAALDVNIEGPSSLYKQYWSFDYSSDPCNLIVTSSIPWNDFRKNLGGIGEKRSAGSVWYHTQINFEATFAFDLKPETLLSENDKNPHHIQQHTRIVKNKIPFEIHFDLKVNVWSSVNIPSPMLRKASALLETSVLTVSPDSDPIATAQLEFVTIIPSPIWLTGASITVDDPDLQHGLVVIEREDKRDCSNVNYEAFCTQYWRVFVEPKKCDLNGQYTVTVTGACNDASDNCNEPYPNTMDIVFDITSDDYCGVSQTVELEGELKLKPTICNGYLKGSITASSPQGAKISKVEIIYLVAGPTLEGSNFLTIYNPYSVPPTALLSFDTSHPAGNQVDFQFEWVGKQLRCDVTAQVDATVYVEYEATGPYLLSAPSVKQQQFSVASDGKATLLDAEEMHFFQSIKIAADPNAPAAGTETAKTQTSTTNTNTGGKKSPASVVAASATVVFVGIVAALTALL